MPPQSSNEPAPQLSAIPHEVEIHYSTAYSYNSGPIAIPEPPQGRLAFTRTVIALDLATTPVALEVAEEYAATAPDLSECKNPAFFSYPPRSPFPKGYRSFRSAWLMHHFPLLHAAVTSHERRRLRPLVRLNSRSVPIFFNPEGKILPVKVKRALSSAYRAAIKWFFPLRSYRSCFPQASAFDAWDLASTDVLVEATFHNQNCSYNGCECNPSTLRLADCSQWLLSEGHWYRRRLKTGYRERPWYHRRSGETWFWSCSRLTATCILTGLGIPILAACSVPFGFLFCLLLLNKISGGALLNAVTEHVRFLRDIISHIDKSVCPVVVTSPLPCTLSANPDVAGVGTRIASYSQAISLITLLAFSSTHAKPSRWALATTSLAFGISAMLSAAVNQLSLYHMVLAAKFQTLPLVANMIIEIKSPDQRGPYLYIINRMRWVVNLATTLWYSLTAPCFGSQPSCNAYVHSQSYFSISQVVSAPMRMSSIVNAVTALLFVMYDVFLTWGPRRYLAREPAAFPRSYVSWALWSFLIDNTPPITIRSSQSLPLPATMGPNRGRKRLSCIQDLWVDAVTTFVYALPYPKFWRYIIGLCVAITLVRHIERTIALNNVSGDERIWTYGQILAVALGIVPVVQLLQMLGLVPRGVVDDHAKPKRD